MCCKLSMGLTPNVGSRRDGPPALPMKLLQAVEIVMYDETPMEVNREDLVKIRNQRCP